jgi:tRNA(adenine34) deaminase
LIAYASLANVSAAQWMQLALAQAQAAAAAGEVPVGAVLVLENQVVSAAHNQTLQLQDPSAHAEVLALRAAATAVGNHRLLGATLICTLEPCVMCVGALMHARIGRLIFAAREPKTGACGSAFDLLSDPAHGHHVQVEYGLLQAESATLLQQFFQARRSK